MHPLQTCYVGPHNQEAIVYYNTINDACYIVIAVKSVGSWAAYARLHPVAYASENCEELRQSTAQFGDKIPALVAESMFGNFVEDWGYYRI